jgi:ligand-binding sensor domain-containing protein
LFTSQRAALGKGWCGIAFTLAWLAAMNRSACAEPPTPLANSGYLLRTWGTDDGLPESSATAIAQTQDGYLWFGTFNGLVRFNGHRFTVFNPSNTPQLPEAGIVNLHADKRDRLWVSTSEGLVLKDGTQWRALGTDQGWPASYVRTLAERKKGDLLITTFNGQVRAVEQDRPTPLPAPPGEPGEGHLGTVDESGRWWLAQKRFVGFWDGQRWVQIHEPSPSIGRSAIACVAARGGGVWVLLSKELFKFHGDREVSRVSLPQLRGGIWFMAEDSRTSSWICSYDSGLFQVAPGGDLSHWTTTNAAVEHVRLPALREPFALLTDREHEVLRHVVQGKMNKEIAPDLGIHERTVKLHHPPHHQARSALDG